MRKDQIKTSNVRPVALTFGTSFNSHMAAGDRKSGTHAGLHLASCIRIGGRALAAGDLSLNNAVDGRVVGHGVDRACTITLLESDTLNGTFKASVDIYGSAKTSTFFPVGTTLDQAKEYIRAAWTDHCHYGSSSYGGGDVDIYSQLRARYGLNWCGIAEINRRKIWIGCAHSGTCNTAFPAVNAKFG
jgi:hypothetical protein